MVMLCTFYKIATAAGIITCEGQDFRKAEGGHMYIHSSVKAENPGKTVNIHFFRARS